MSWDVLVINPGEAGESPPGTRQTPTEEPLGPLLDVQARIVAHIPELADSLGSTLWHCRGMGYGIEFDFGGDDPVRNILLHVVGFGDPIWALIRFARPNGWALIDCGDGELIDLEAPSYEGWVAWQMFAYGRDPKVVKVSRSGGPRVLCLKHPPDPANAALFAEGIVQSARKVTGVALDYSLASLAAVEATLDGFRADGETFQFLAETLFGFGCYVGEVVIRECGGAWVPAREAPGVSDFPLALRLSSERGVVDPASRVTLRLEQGGAAGLADWVKGLAQR